MLIVNTDFITDKNLQTLGVVHGIGLAFTRKGEIGQIHENMRKEAKELGADAIINVRYTYGERGIFAAGTAVKYIF